MKSPSLDRETEDEVSAALGGLITILQSLQRTLASGRNAEAAVAAAVEQPQPKKRGRPPGSKNKPKPEAAAVIQPLREVESAADGLDDIPTFLDRTRVAS